MYPNINNVDDYEIINNVSYNQNRIQSLNSVTYQNNQNLNQMPNRNIYQMPNTNINQMPNTNIYQMPNTNTNQMSNRNINQIESQFQIHFNDNSNIQNFNEVPANYNNINIQIKNNNPNIIENNNSNQFLNTNKINNTNLNQNQKTGQNIILNNNNLGSNVINVKLTNEEIEKAKENGFILIGKTGVGKTSLLNVICGEEKGKVGYSTKSETKTSNFYCMKEKIGSEYKYFCIVDTPGLYDTNGKCEDKNQKQEIIKLISEEKIKVKGLLFLTNFQNERFDDSEQNSLIEYNAIFPLKEFWKRIIIIFTHYYGDPDGDTKEEIQKKSEQILSKIFKVIMNKVKIVSDPVKFSQVNNKYINIYSKVKNKKQIENNLSVRKIIINELISYTKFSPMFTKIQIFNFEKYQLQPNDKFLYDCIFFMFI